MIFTKQQVEDILSIIDYHHSFSIMVNVGVDVLSTVDIELLKSFGIDPKDYEGLFTPFMRMYYLGLLSSSLSDQQLNTVNFEDFTQYFRRGQYKPLTSGEKFQLDVAKRKTYSHLKGLANRSKMYMEDLILEKEKTLRKEYEKVISEEIERGVTDRKAIQSIISEIGHRMEDWQRDWGRIVETEMNDVFQGGKAQQWIEEDEETLVYKTVYPLACRHCIRLYLEAGVGSKPIVYKLATLIENGNNINRKVDDWKPAVGSTHPFCRCNLNRLPKGYEWNPETERFELNKDKYSNLKYKGVVKIKIGDKVLETNKS